MVLKTFMSALGRVVSLIVSFFNNIARNIKRFLIDLFKPQERLKASYIKTSFSKIETLTIKDDCLNIRNDYKRIGKDLNKAIETYEG